ncbi:hyperpolarization-activated voltage-gated potassium channel [Methanothermococcus sp. Ax23]|jgi:voltage-gated potassium channel|uniref:hyperpolarization-activated voltage-gated potassium channel n=1 Tax=Methanothermococcus sp. Ax23 TaxID=3156486 RepID=UPI003BA23AB8
MATLHKIYTPRILNTVEIIGILCTIEILISFILSTYNPPYEYILMELDFISISFLTFEFFYKLMGAKNKLKFFKNIYNIIDAIVVGAFALYLLQMTSTTAVVSLRIINAVRILILLRVIKFKHLNLSRESINFITILIFSFILSCFIWLAENEVNPKINNFADAFYFTVISITTIGYGDITPQTMWGKIIIVLAVLYIVSGLITRAQKIFEYNK